MRQHKFAIIAIAATILTSASAFGGVNRWTSRGPEGASITAIVADPSDAATIYAATAGGVFRTDARMTEPVWTPVNEGLSELMLTAFAVQPSEPPTLWAGTGSGRMYRSIDRGERWTEVVKPASGPIRQFAFEMLRELIYVATGTGVLKSRDGGLSWEFVPEFRRMALGVAAAPDGTVYVATHNAPHVYVSTDGGQTWTATAIGYTLILVADPKTSTIFAAGPVSIALSSNRGKSWVAFPNLAQKVNSLFPMRDVLYAATSGGLYAHHHEDGWTRIGGAIADATSVVVLPEFNWLTYLGTAGGMFVADEASAGWRPANQGLSGASVFDIALNGNETAYAGTETGLFKAASADGAWQRVPSISGSVRHVASNGTAAIYATGSGGIHGSVDGGMTWNIVTPRISNALATSATAAIYSAFAEFLAKSTDGGDTWDNISYGLPFSEWWFYYGFHPNVLETDDQDPAAAYVASEDELLITGDGGHSWSRILGKDREVLALAARRPMIHVALDKGITSSFDGGQSWSPLRLADESVHAIVIDPLESARLYAGTASGRVYRSDDFGSEWTLFGDGLPRAPVRRLVVNRKGTRLYAATTAGVFEYDIVASTRFHELPVDPERLPRLMKQLPAADTSGLILPAVGTVRGSGGAVFRTDLTLSNGRSIGQDVIVAWLAGGNPGGSANPSFLITLPPFSDDGGGTLTVADIAGELRLEGLGSMVVIAVDAEGNVDRGADIDAVARIRSASPCGRGSVSQSLAAVALHALDITHRGRVLGLRHDTTYRTNVGVINLSEVHREFTVVVDGERRDERFVMVVPPFSPLQAAIPDGNYGPLALTVLAGSGGPWLAYGSTVDNGSGDAWASVSTPLPRH